MESKQSFGIQMVPRHGESTKAKGFQMFFGNGLGISVQFGDGRGENQFGFLYCDQESVDERGGVENTTAEIAVFRAHIDNQVTSGFYPLSKYDDVVGYVTPDKVGKVIGILANEPDATRALGPGDPLGFRKILEEERDDE